MHMTASRLLSGIVLAATFALAPVTLIAQDHQSSKYLYIQREMLKPGQGAPHERSEQAWAAASLQAKSTSFYTGLSSMTGPERALFLFSYTSLADWQNKSDSVSPAGQATLDRIYATDGELLTGVDDALFKIEPALSTNTFSSNVGTRFLEIEAYLIKPGHEEEFTAAVKQYVKLAAGHPEIHFTTYSMLFGSSDGAQMIALSAYKTLAEADASLAAQEALFKEMAPKDAEMIMGAIRTSVIWHHDNLFRVSPKLSYPSPDMIQSEPSFWKPTPTSTKK